MVYPRANYREVNGLLSAPGQMFGDNAPGATWQLTFASLHLQPKPFVYPPTYPYFDLPLTYTPPQKKHKSPSPTPTPTTTPTTTTPSPTATPTPSPHLPRHRARAALRRIGPRAGVPPPLPSRSTATAASDRPEPGRPAGRPP